MRRISVILFLLVAEPALAREISLVVRETAGIRRFGYPVAVKLSLPTDLTGKERFLLWHKDKQLGAQFRPLSKREVWLDFNTSLGPLEKQTFRVEYRVGRTITGASPVKEEAGAFTVNWGGMFYTVPAGLNGFLGEVRGGKLQYMKPGSQGLFAVKGKTRVAIKGLKGRIARMGRFASCLEFKSDAAAVQLTFPRSKSWVEVAIEASGADAIEADLNLELTSPAMVDFGAGSGVYVALKKGQSALLASGERRWETSVGGKPYVIAASEKSIAEGWAHAMDRTRCVAIALEGFAGKGNQIAIDAGGGLRLQKSGSKMRFWLHFVPAPVHVGAVTSPQSMLAPLSVTIQK